MAQAGAEAACCHGPDGQAAPSGYSGPRPNPDQNDLVFRADALSAPACRSPGLRLLHHLFPGALRQDQERRSCRALLQRQCRAGALRASWKIVGSCALSVPSGLETELQRRKLVPALRDIETIPDLSRAARPQAARPHGATARIWLGGTDADAVGNICFPSRFRPDDARLLARAAFRCGGMACGQQKSRNAVTELWFFSVG